MFGKHKTDVVIAGGGPVGLFTAIALHERQVEVEVYDQDPRLAARSYALALHPGSLRLLDEVGLAQDLIAEGQRIDRIRFYDDERVRATIEYGTLGGPFPFLLVVPQSTLESLLLKRLGRAKVRVRWNHRVQQLEPIGDHVEVHIDKLDQVSLGYPISMAEATITKQICVEARFVIGADGYESRVRNVLEIDHRNYGDAGTFFVTEFESDREVEPELRVVFDGPWSHVCWPLGDHRVRWSFQIDPSEMEKPDPRRLVRFIEERAPWFQARPNDIIWTTLVRFERRLAARFGNDRIWLAGDAAHLTGPIGVQSVNVGLREGHDLAARMAGALSGGDRDGLAGYEQERQEEWRTLLGLNGELELGAQADPWVEQHRDRLLSSIPASAADLDALLQQIAPTR